MLPHKVNYQTHDSYQHQQWTKARKRTVFLDPLWLRLLPSQYVIQEKGNEYSTYEISYLSCKICENSSLILLAVARTSKISPFDLSIEACEHGMLAARLREPYEQTLRWTISCNPPKLSQQQNHDLPSYLNKSFNWPCEGERSGTVQDQSTVYGGFFSGMLNFFVALPFINNSWSYFNTKSLVLWCHVKQMNKLNLLLK